jgi:hypothetical protein
MRVAALAATTIVLIGTYLAVAATLAFAPGLIAAGTATIASLGAIAAVVSDAGTDPARTR